MESSNYQFVICSDALCFKTNGKCAFGCAMFYKRSLVHPGSAERGSCASRMNKRGAKEFRLDHIIFLIDSIKVVHAIGLNGDWSLQSLVANIGELSKSFEHINIRHLSRTLNINTGAHSLVKFCTNSTMDAEFFDSFLDWLEDQSR